uniref:EF-hand domain-containing protein n=1 Tax=Syphacia muris TaxID=451379 RepID=A0A0N5AVQ5_9BILA
MAELLKHRDFVHPPPIDELCRQTEEVFSHKYIKYMYSRFKNECPTGRMRMHEFKQMFGSYVLERLTEDYLIRLFNAFSKSKTEITFQDLMDALATLNAATPRSNAVWAIRMMKGCDDTRVDFQEFSNFVKSVYQLSNKNEKKASTISSSAGKKCAVQIAARRKAEETFNVGKKDSTYIPTKPDGHNHSETFSKATEFAVVRQELLNEKIIKKPQ